MTKVLIVDVHAEQYRDQLREKFPALQFTLFHSAKEVTGDLSDIDVMIMFGIEVRDFMLAGAPRLQWIQSLATGVDHFLRCPSLKPNVLITSGRGIHGPPMREQVVYMMMAISRDAVRAGRRPEGAFLGAAAVEHAARQDRGDRRHRRRRQRHRRVAQGARHARHRRHPRAARGRRASTR